MSRDKDRFRENISDMQAAKRDDANPPHRVLLAKPNGTLEWIERDGEPRTLIHESITYQRMNFTDAGERETLGVFYAVEDPFDPLKPNAIAIKRELLADREKRRGQR